MSRSIDQIWTCVDRFIQFAETHKELQFLVKRIGCGIAGLKDSQVAPLFKMTIDMENVILPKEFMDILMQ